MLYKYLYVWGILKDFIYFLERGEGKGERERNISVWLPLMCPQLGTWPETQACALTGNRTSDPLVCRPVLSQYLYVFMNNIHSVSCYPILHKPHGTA